MKTITENFNKLTSLHISCPVTRFEKQNSLTLVQWDGAYMLRRKTSQNIPCYVRLTMKRLRPRIKT